MTRLVLAGALAAALVAGCRGRARGPAAASCREAAERIAGGMRQLRPELSEAKVDPTADVARLCTEDRWAPAVVSCFAAASTAAASRRCAGELTVPQRAHARVVQEDVYARAAKVLRERRGGTGIAECDQALDQLDALVQCDAAPKPTLAQLEASFAPMRARWIEAAESRDPQARRAAVADCLSVVESLRQVSDALGC